MYGSFRNNSIQVDYTTGSLSERRESKMPSTGVSILQKMSIESNFKNQYVSIFALFDNTY